MTACAVQRVVTGQTLVKEQLLTQRDLVGVDRPALGDGLNGFGCEFGRDTIACVMRPAFRIDRSCRPPVVFSPMQRLAPPMLAAKFSAAYSEEG